MAANRKPRKPYRPKPALARPMVVGISDDDTRALKLIPHAALERLRTGGATETDWHTLTCRLNFGMVLANRFPFGVVDEMRAALDAMISIQGRHGRTARWGATGDELVAIGDGLRHTDDMQDATTRRDHRDALQVVLASAT
jgi:hypothetical protein